ncbi:MAG: hypothetical protein HY720_14910 [Planctomycetes bacterium]|nr:hypothetical protein [Planctomycetota bacterium]
MLRPVLVPLLFALAALTVHADLSFDRYHRYDEMEAWLREQAEDHPDFVRLLSAGKSVEGRELWVAVVTNFGTGDPADKPAVYVDGCHHGNEVASGEVPLWLVRFLVENRERFEVVRMLLATRAFYVLPRVNPDSSEWYFRGVEVRGNLHPKDDDRDGRVDEDGPDDVDGDGLVLEMAVPDPKGDFVFDEISSRPRRRRPGESGNRFRIAREGSDEDGDGKVDEDGPNEGSDLNRNYPDPAGLFAGLAETRLTEPESRAVDAFLRAHPNVSNVQSFHTFGGILFRPFGSVPDTYVPEEDLALYDRMAANFTRYTGDRPYGRPYGPMSSIRGALIDHAYGELGAFAVTAEVWRVPGEDTREVQSWSGGLEGIVGPKADRAWREFNEKVLGGKAYIEWREREHPLYGRVRIGGWSPWFKRNPPPAYLEEVCRKASMFSLYQALMTPRVAISSVRTTAEGGGRLRIEATVENEGVYPTVTHLARQMGRKDPVVVRLLERGSATPDKNRDRELAREEIDALEGEESRNFTFTVGTPEGSDLWISIESTKGGKAARRVAVASR